MTNTFIIIERSMKEFPGHGLYIFGDTFCTSIQYLKMDGHNTTS